MWSKKSRTNTLLEPLAAAIAGEVSDGRLAGTYAGYGVDARPHKGYPLRYAPSSQGGGTVAEVEMFELTLTGVRGRSLWRCQSSASSAMQDLASRMTAGRLLRRFQAGEFKFEGVDTLREGTERLGAKLVKALGVPVEATADEDLQQRLIEAGLFDELAALRWGAHPYLPKASFRPSGGELATAYTQSAAFRRVEPRANEQLAGAGLADYASMLRKQVDALQSSQPGALSVVVEAGKERVPSAARFRELLDRAVRIAQLNERANPPSQ
jgi:hypothetical protein